MKQHRYYIVIALLLLQIRGIAQYYPAEAFFNLSPPFPVYLSDYANPMGNNVALRLVFRDFNLGTRQVRLKLCVQGQNFQTCSLPGVLLPEYTITAGVPLLLQQADLYQYFLPQNLDLNPVAYAQAMPEGIYRFTVQVIDAQSGRSISSELQSVPYWFTVNDPPIINLPQNNSKVMVQYPQNLVFQWAARSKQASAVEYEFSITELTVPVDFEGNLQNIFLSQPPYYQIITNTSTLLYGPGEPPLIEGRQYAVRVQARAKKGLEQIGIFRNNGYSEVTVFQYKTDKPALAEIQQTVTVSKSLLTDTENYLVGEYGQIVKQNEVEFGRESTKRILPNNRLSLNDTLSMADLTGTLVSENQVQFAVSLPEFGTKTLRYYLTDDFKINIRNEIINGGLNTIPTQISLKIDSTKLQNTKATANLVNKPSLFGALLLLHDAKVRNNNAYHDLRSHALKAPNEIRELNVKLNAYMVLLKDKLNLIDKVLRNYNGTVVFAEISPALLRIKKQEETNIANLTDFLRKYDSYYKNDYAQLVLNYLPNGPVVSSEYSYYKELVTLEWARLDTEKLEELEKGIKKLNDEREEKARAIGAFPANTNTADYKRLDDKYEDDLKNFKENIENKYARLKAEATAKFQKMTATTEKNDKK
jgi:hypothetical protein